MDFEKDKLCEENNIHLIHVREPKCEAIGEYKYQIITPKPTTNGTHMTEPIKQILLILKTDFNTICDIDVDCLRDNADICRMVLSTKGFNSLRLRCPSVASEWDYEKNYPLTPDYVAVRSGKKAWWICSNGHSYSSTIASRTGQEACGCPICSNKSKSLYENGHYIGSHSLAAERPDIAKEFDENKNGISAKDISVSSNKKCGSNAQDVDVNGRVKSIIEHQVTIKGAQFAEERRLGCHVVKQ